MSCSTHNWEFQPLWNGAYLTTGPNRVVRRYKCTSCGIWGYRQPGHKTLSRKVIPYQKRGQPITSPFASWALRPESNQFPDPEWFPAPEQPEIPSYLDSVED